MTDKEVENLEGVIGGKIEQASARVVPGTVFVEGQQVIYFSDDGVNKFRQQFKKITCFTNPPYATSGGVNERGCSITTPGGILFHAISYHGDLEGWRKDIEAGAQGLNLLLASIEHGRLIVSDGSSASLDDCRIDFS